jgi:N-acetylmuramoyl-L-alanine amidase
MLHIILDRGHGIDTPGKRSKIWPNGKQLLEWEFNQKVINKIEPWLKENPELFTYSIYPKKQEDIHILKRKRLYERFAKNQDTLVLSIHGDAFGKASATGGTCYTSPGRTKSDAYAARFKAAFKYYNLKVRSSKEAKFTVLMGKNYRAVLIEMGFYTNYEQCMFMLSEEGISLYANMVIKGLLDIFKDN